MNDTMSDKWNWLEMLEEYCDATTDETSTTERHDGNPSGVQATIHLPSVHKRWRRINRIPPFSPTNNNKTFCQPSVDERKESLSSSSSSLETTSPRGRCSHSLTAVGKYSLVLCGGANSTTVSVPSPTTVLEEGQPQQTTINKTLFEPLNDLWMLNATTATWSEIHPTIVPSPPPISKWESATSYLSVDHESVMEEDETNDSFWGMSELFPARRGHMAAYYEDSPSHHQQRQQQHTAARLPREHSTSPRRHPGVLHQQQHGRHQSRLVAHHGNHHHAITHKQRRLLIVFGGVANQNTAPSPTTSTTLPDENRHSETSLEQQETYLNDVWVFDFDRCMWRKLHATTAPVETSSSSSSPTTHAAGFHYDDENRNVDSTTTTTTTAAASHQSIPPPSPRRHAVCWVADDYFCILGGDIQGPPDGHFLFTRRHRQNRHDNNPFDDDDDDDVRGHDTDRRYRTPTYQGMYVYKLGPLSNPVSRWRWSLQATTNRYVLHKRGPNWPTVTLPPRRVSALLNSASVLVGRKLWIHGGVELVDRQYKVPTNYLYRLDLDTWEWVIVQGLKRGPCARCHHGMSAIGKYLIVGGGMGCLSRKDVVVDVEVRLPEDNIYFDDDDDDNDYHDNNDDDHVNHRHHDHQQHQPGGERRFMVRSIFDLHILDTETLTWTQEHSSNITGNWPNARNAFGMTRLGHSKVVVFGGGVFPDTYFDDTHVLEFDLPLSFMPTNDSATTTTTSDRSTCRDIGGGRGPALLRSDLASLFEFGLLSDLTLHVGADNVNATTTQSQNTQTFHVHKAILACRCTFFETMFTGPYAEAQLSEISIPDADPMAVHVVLRFLYTGLVDTSHVLSFQREVVVPDESLSSSTTATTTAPTTTTTVNPYLVSAVLQLCDKWNVHPLGRTLEDALSTTVLKGLVDPIELVAFAREHNCHRLTMFTLAHVKQHWDSLRCSESFQHVEPPVVAEIKDYVHSLL